MKRYIKLFLDMFFLCRPVLLIPVWGFSVFGWYSAQQSLAPSSIAALWHKDFFIPFLWMLIFSLSVACVYVLNQVADFEVDSKNEGFPLLVRSGISLQIAKISAWCAGVAGVLIPLFAGRYILSVLSCATIVVGYFYSFKPWSFSGRPILDFVSNALGYGIIAFGAGYSTVVGHTSLLSAHFFMSSIPYFLLMCAGSISSTLPDIPGDRACGKKTTAVFFGARFAQWMAFGFICAAAVTSYLQIDTIALVGALLSIPVYCAYFISPKQIWVEACYKIGGAAVMLLAVAIMPVLALASGGILFCTWLYFRYRFGIAYPSLVPVPLKKDIT